MNKIQLSVIIVTYKNLDIIIDCYQAFCSRKFILTLILNITQAIDTNSKKP